MKNWKTWLWILLGVILFLVAVNLAFYFFFLDFVVDYWWFSSLDYGYYFFLRLLYRYLVFVGVTLVFFLIFFINFWFAFRILGAVQPSSAGREQSRRFQRMLEMFRTGSLAVYTPLSLVLAIFVAYPLFEKWEIFLFYLFGPQAGITDPAYGKDISYYLFSYPLYSFLERRLLYAFVILLASSLILYWIKRRMFSTADRTLPKGLKIYLNVLALLTIALFGWQFLLKRYALLYNTEHMPLFFGPGFTQMNVTLPLIWAGLAAWILAACCLLFFINKRKGLIPAVSLTVVFAAVIGLLNTTFVTDLVQRYLVLPNELSREAPYIENSVEASLAAYNLSGVKTRKFDVQTFPWTETAGDISKNIRNIPVWDRPMLDAVYDQLQSIRPYYNFTGADVDRYNVAGRYQQVNLAAREINLSNMPAAARNWTNRRLQYTHGYGMVMTPAAQSGRTLMNWYIKGIPPETDYDFTLAQPAIYYGQEDHNYVIAPNEVGEMDYPEGDGFVSSDYTGKVGVPIDTLFRKLILSEYFDDRNILFTTKTQENSKILFRRNFRTAIGVLTPFFDLDQDPYLVITEDGLYWIQDAYTKSRWFPNAARYDGIHNYIRNSVKIVIDAYDGTIDYYIADASDPIIEAYSRMYPGLLKPMDQMPDDVRKHVRYPKDIFTIQMNIYKKYHQSDPGTFYREEDIWEFAEKAIDEGEAGEAQAMDPYYLTLNLIEKERQEFLLLVPMSPKNRPNLRSLVIAGCDREHYGEFFVYSFPKGELVYGPAQINALIEQDTDIAEQFTLWDQRGSEVKRGRMIILPIGKMVFYIQPVYLTAATKLKIPQLQRLIISQGSMVAMDVSLDEAFSQIEKRLKDAGARLQPPAAVGAPPGALPETQIQENQEPGAQGPGKNESTRPSSD